MSTDRTLDRVDDTLAEWDEWDGHSPDAARWAGGPDESEWPDRTEWYTYTPDRTRADALRDVLQAEEQRRERRRIRAAVTGGDYAGFLFGVFVGLVVLGLLHGMELLP